MKCYLHPKAEATKPLNVPCAPGGKIWICRECVNDPDIVQKVFEKYRLGHINEIRLFKAPGNPGN